MKIFLTGGSGFIGRRFIKLALSNGHLIYAVTRNRKFVNKKNLIWLIGEIDKDWKKYEHLMSDIFDHLLASVNFFKLECFELSYNYSNLRGK